MSGLPAFPLLTEMNLLVRWLGLEHPASGFGEWLLRVRDAPEATYASYPFSRARERPAAGQKARPFTLDAVSRTR